jgi:GDP-L-fucose synthase
MNRSSKVFVAGNRGLVGSAIVRALQREGYSNLVLRGRAELDLRRQDEVDRFFADERPEIVFLAAAKVGGILANDLYRADFIRDNLQIQTNVIDAAHRAGVEKFLFLGSSCIYPKNAPQPMREEHLLTGPLEPTNEAYAVAKIAGIMMVQAFRRQFGFPGVCLMPTNLYGPGDSFDLQTSHVLPALIRKFHEAKAAGGAEVVVWGSGTPRREFLHVDDLAEACLFVMQHYDGEGILNVGVGQDVSIRDLAELIRGIVGFDGRLRFDESKPDGAPRKLLDVSRLDHLGWRARIPLDQGIKATYDAFVFEAQRGQQGDERR